MIYVKKLFSDDSTHNTFYFLHKNSFGHHCEFIDAMPLCFLSMYLHREFTGFDVLEPFLMRADGPYGVRYR
jgi:hypothetical protein